MRKIVIGAFLLCSCAAFSQRADSDKSDGWKKIYRASAPKINDLVHTKLEVKFDYSKSWMFGKVWITLHPHFYSTDSLTLDAKAMNIKEVAIIKNGKHVPLKYVYDSLNLFITLDKSYKGGENYTIFIDYVSKPNEIHEKGSMAIGGAKGLYFINPLGKEKDPEDKDKLKPTQIWTQGETESNSSWVPIIDKPNQKTTDEISMTVLDKYKTLSNGLLVSQKKNADGTRTDTWKMDLPHAPYLMMMAVGEYSIIKDSYKGKEVSYYIEKEYAPVARKIFGLTPEMIRFYSRITGVDYPWAKYSQIVGRDYVSGAMENTTATLHQQAAQQNARQLIDGNNWESVIAHELFHQWFGDYVTTESWSNLTLNESFADFSEILWYEYKHGKDAADEHNYNSMQNYLRSFSDKKELVRFYYSSREDMFDLVSYQKGGRILNMLKNYVGDSAFFKSLNLYLNTRKFKSAEAQDLRLAFEEITGQDLNWFWNQWYYGSGHPRLDISYDYDAAGKTAKVFIKQTQSDKVFKFRIAIDVYQGSEKKRNFVWCEHQVDTFTFPSANKPDLINVDGDKVLLCDKTEHKNMDNYVFQYKNAGLYLDRREAIDYATRKQEDDPKALALLTTALKDKYYGLRTYALQKFNLRNDSIKKLIEPLINELAKNDPNSLVRAAAIEALGKYKKEAYKPVFLNAINDSSYSISGNALLALGAIDSTLALEKAKVLSAQHVKGALAEAITNLLFMYADEKDFDSLAVRFDNLPFGQAKFMILQPFANFLKHVKNTGNFMKGIDMIVHFRDTIPKQYRQQIEAYINGMILNSIVTAKQASGMTEQANYVKSKLPGQPKTTTVFEVSKETLQKYAGSYDLNGTAVKLSIKDEKALSLSITGQPDMELVPVSKDKFSVKLMDGYSVEFNRNEKDEVVEMVFTSPGGQSKAQKKK
jgi:aminopeptidase N